MTNFPISGFWGAGPRPAAASQAALLRILGLVHHYSNMTRRRLPHVNVMGSPMFITFRLFDSLPANRAFPASSMTSGEAFITMDRALDQARSGPTFLRQALIADVVLHSIDCGVTLQHYELYAWVIMPNHVHVLLTPKIDLSKLLGSLKAASAKRANIILDRMGRPFWQDESFDYVVRNGEQFRNIKRYIENNPVAAGLVANPEEYCWSSAGRPGRPPQAGGLPPKG